MNVPKLRFKDNNGNDYPQWEKKKLKEISDVSSGKRIPKGMPFPSRGETFYITVSDMGENFVSPININTINDEIETIIKKYKVYTGDIIISVAGTLGKINLITSFFNNANLTENCDRISNFKKVFNLYIFYFLKSNIIQEMIKKSSTLSSQPKLALERIRNFNISIPLLEEQKKIANFLSTVDKKISNLEDIITNLENQKKGLLQQIFSQKIRFKDENGNNYPDWEKKKLGDISNLITKGTTPPNFNNGNINFIKVESIINAKINLSKCMSISENIHSTLLSRSILKENDILFAIAGSLGITCIVNKEVLPANTNQALAIIRLSNNINVNYIFWILNSNIMKKYIKISHSIGAQPNLNLKQLNDFILPYPCLEEQTKIADFLSAFDRKIVNQKAQLEHWKQIKKGLLQQMFV